MRRKTKPIPLDANEQGGAAPRIVDAPKPITTGKLNEQLLLTCLAQGFPRPQLRWFRALGLGETEPFEWAEIGTTTTPLAANESARYLVSQEANLLLIKALQPTDNRAKFRCTANNSFGVHQADVELRVELWPPSKQVEIEPRSEFINNADFQHQSVVFNCTIRAGLAPVLAVEWLKNGRSLFALAVAHYLAGAPNWMHKANANNDLFAHSDAINNTNGNNIALPGIFDEPGQELSAIEYYLAAGSSSGESAGSVAMMAPDSQQQVDPPDTPRWLSADAAGEHAKPQQHQSNQVIVSNANAVRLSKLAGEQDGLLAALDPQTPATTGRRLRQRARLVSRDVLLYQLHIEQARRTDRGAYQCRARSATGSQQASANLMLKDNPPQFVDTFASQLIGSPAAINSDAEQAAGQVSLRCVASGSPLPEISWTLSGFPVPELSRFRVGDYVTRDGLIVSFVNISNVQPEGE